MKGDVPVTVKIHKLAVETNVGHVIDGASNG